MTTNRLHDMEPVKVQEPIRPQNWAATLWVAYSKCKRCGETMLLEQYIPDPLLDFIHPDRRREAMMRTSEFVQKRLEAYITFLRDNPNPPALCERK